MNVKLIPEAEMTSNEKQQLRTRLDQFYDSVTDYLAFSNVSDQRGCWIFIGDEIKKQKAQSATTCPLRILEVGAGKSGFGEWLKANNLRSDVKWTIQDVTRSNAEWLEKQADNRVYGDIRQIPSDSRFDIIFSTYVLEHVTDPEEHLNRLHSLLSENGKLFIFSPRYDVPGYLCPSSQHLSFGQRMLIGTKAFVQRIKSLLNRKPAFLIQTDLAAFHRPFFIDADAVHWVSLQDIKLWARRKKSRFTKLYDSTAGPVGSKNWIVKRFMTCAVMIEK